MTEQETATSGKTISLVIRVRNSAADLQRCLSQVRKQAVPQGHTLEIVVVDNDSNDPSAQTAEQFGAVVVHLPTRDFSWGRALNCGVAAASGDLIVILSADACPADSQWLTEMTRHFADSRVAAVYGRQLPRDDAPIDEVVRLKKTFCASTEEVRSLAKDYTPYGGSISISNASAAIRRDIWKAMPYDEALSGAEEGPWTYRLLNMGYRVVYEANARVYHSHNDSILRSAWRNLELVRANAVMVGRRVTAFSYVRFLQKQARTRIRNFFYPGLRTRTRMKGLLLLPLEMALFCIATFFFHDERKALKYRSFFWDH